MKVQLDNNQGSEKGHCRRDFFLNLGLKCNFEYILDAVFFYVSLNVMVLEYADKPLHVSGYIFLEIFKGMTVCD